MAKPQETEFSFLVEDDDNELRDMGLDSEFQPAPVMSSKKVAIPSSAPDSGESDSDSNFYRLKFYTSYFDVTGPLVWRRLQCALLPWKANFLEPEETPDLYGPLWVAVTLVIAISISSELHMEFSSSSEGIERPALQFHHLILAFTVILGYVFLGSTAVWAVRRYYGVGCPLAHTVCIYGYSMTPLILSALLSVTSVRLLNFALHLLAWTLSTAFLYRNFWKLGLEDDQLSFADAVNWKKPAQFIALGSSMIHIGLGFFLSRMRYS